MTRLWVIGDSWTDPSYGGWGWSCGWVEQIAVRLGLGLVNSGRNGSGYVRIGSPSGMCHGMQAARGAGAGADAVIVWGSINDSTAGATAEQVQDNAAATLRLIRAACPGAALLVYGPQGTDAPPSPLMWQHRDAVREAALDAGALFADPLLWIQGRADLLDPTTHHPTCDGHAYLADRIAPDLLFAVATRAGRLPEPIPDDGAGWVAPWAIGDAATIPVLSLSSST